MSATTLQVALGDRSYPIFIGEDLFKSVSYIKPYIGAKQVFIVTNETVAPLYLDIVKTWLADLDSSLKMVEHIMPDGEQHKTLSEWSCILDSLMTAGFNRKATLVALGGGVVGDMAGFAAACYQRGIDFIQIPTTLLSQVDSSVGGKTGVNHALGKNMIGAFYQPKAVVIDTLMLRTLPERELSAGLAEVIKYGLIYDQHFFIWLEQNIQGLRVQDSELLQTAIKRSCEIKAEVVSKDEKEGGLRAILNLGHTFGHAIETEMGYGNWLHGEAVGAGMVMACEFSERLGWLTTEWVDRAIKLVAAAGLPVAPPPKMTVASFMKHMSVDKKVLDGQIRLVLLKDCGQAIVTSDFDPECLKTYLRDAIAAHE